MTASSTPLRPTSSAPRLQPDRVVVPDVLRGVAIVAMLVAHAMPLLPAVSASRPASFVAGNVNDLASPLFALVMGMSASIVLARPGASPTRVLVQNLIRGAVLVALGLWLATWGSWIAIVLAFLGIVLVVGTPILLLSSRVVAVVAVVLAVVGAPVNTAVASAVDPVLLGQQSPLGFAVRWVFLDPHYRVTSLLPFFLLGALLLRHGFRRDRLLVALAAVALPAYAVRPLVERAFGVDSASGSHADTLHDLGLVLAAHVAVVLLTTVRSPRARPIIAAVFTPFRAVGSLALSVYVLQVGVVVALLASGVVRGVQDPAGALLLVLGVWAVGVLWWRFVGSGPIEWATRLVTRFATARIR
ncbi:DUF418 domain-containing protein [Rathayibacter sp. SD072]|uniref:DUF418 domain-containing protein n=1 Tax=Rathayibacter sp. SD072 TaxID=2781731 RepID=UPI001A95EF53|nr:DUF418 domain-containing protein [Rathayibacter sp. SD072]MBO0985750.1 DUF418 domain-containing protein [Rathayibacter sp. SD072]